jgi:hypothetical protein
MGVTPRAFYNGKGLVPTWHEASRFAGADGRIATLPDIIDSRLQSDGNDVAWSKYFTTTSAEYVGIGRNGRKLIIVAHGVGPLSTIDGITSAYKHEYRDETRRNRGGRISLAEFHKLERGVYGRTVHLTGHEAAIIDKQRTHDALVFVIDYEHYVHRFRHRYPFLGSLSQRILRTDPLLLARFGGRRRRKQYLRQAAAFAAHEAGISYNPDPFLLELHDASNCAYRLYPEAEEQGQFALAHLLSISQLTHTSHRPQGHAAYITSLVSEVSCHEWGNGCRFVGVPPHTTEAAIRPEWNVRQIMAAHWPELMVPAPELKEIGLRPLTKLGNTWFTQRPHKGASMATGSPEFVVTAMEQIGRQQMFTTDIRGYHAFFRYDIREAGLIAPEGANAFFMGEPEIIWKAGNPVQHRAPITFYKISADLERLLPDQDELSRDYDTLMRLSG